jgi:hypothetical protein
VRTSPLAAEALHRRAQQTAAAARSRGPATTLSEAADLLLIAEVAAVAAPGTAQRRSLHRTASLAALTAAQAAQRARRPAGDFLLRAVDHANGAGDGPLKAQALMLQRDGDGEAGRAAGGGSQASLKLLTAALDAAGSGQSSASVRAGVLFRLAWERAALGDVHGALQELEGADASAAMAQVSPDYVEDVELRTGGAAARRGNALRVARCPVEAEATLAEALTTHIHPAGTLVVLGKLRAAVGDVDGAVAALEDGFLEAHTIGNVRAEAAARAATTTLPDGAAVRSLRDLLKG